MRKGYRFGVAWIALNDETGAQADTSMAGSVRLLADLFDKASKTIAQDVLRYRAKHAERIDGGSAWASADGAGSAAD